ILQDHCVRLIRSPDASRIGLAFEPTRERRRVPEIRGVLWLDRASAELRALEYRYTNVTPEQEAYAGGTMDFARLGNGAWMIARWNIGMPIVQYDPPPPSARTHTPEPRVVQLHVTGSELAIVTRNRDTLWMAPRRTLVGTVVDSISD